MKNYIIIFILYFFFEGCNSDCGLISMDQLQTEEGGGNSPLAYKLKYYSNDLVIEGFLVRPQLIDTPLPIIIYNRGGNRDFGLIENNRLNYLKMLASHGYVVIASQYRGNSTSDGKDQMGGADVEDIENLIRLVSEMKFVDPLNVGTLGYSRGGMMSLILSRQSDRMKTHITIGAPTNLFHSGQIRPILYEEVLKPLIGDSISFKESYIDRSSVFWAKDIKVPILLLHGSNDWRVDKFEFEQLVDSLTYYNKEFKSILIEEGNHALHNYPSRDSIIINWFNKYLKN